ncbi:unnamed protein product [Acanthosepion pharaonis]|uniref:Uncharacterized protein n=1 Tax=Acanthosepion pharaonis TaxID=158019 RepID=A0A812BIP3_ACAPH|nr:unnamed protein product [Sepia pharaonis]
MTGTIKRFSFDFTVRLLCITAVFPFLIPLRPHLSLFPSIYLHFTFSRPLTRVAVFPFLIPLRPHLSLFPSIYLHFTFSRPLTRHVFIGRRARGLFNDSSIIYPSSFTVPASTASSNCRNGLHCLLAMFISVVLGFEYFLFHQPPPTNVTLFLRLSFSFLFASHFLPLLYHLNIGLDSIVTIVAFSTSIYLLIFPITLLVSILSSRFLSLFHFPLVLLDVYQQLSLIFF